MRIATLYFNSRIWGEVQEEEYTTLLQHLTETFVSIKNSRNNYVYFKERFYPYESKINLFLFYIKNYDKYKFNDTTSIYEAPDLPLKKLNTEELLFEEWMNNKDSVGLNAVIKLSVSNANIVTSIAKQYENSYFDSNRNIESNAYDILRMAVLFTEYCFENKINFFGSDTLKNKIRILQEELTFQDRYKLENEFINSLTLNEVEAFEYWTLINGFDYNNDYQCSAGRILDKFYSKHFYKLLENDNYFYSYLKKSALFENPKIHLGVCENYLNKFLNRNPELSNMLSKKNIDINIREKLKRMNNNFENKNREKIKKEWDGNKDFKVRNFEKKLKKLTGNITDTIENRRQILTILSRISYKQIGIALNIIENAYFQNSYEKYDFMERDWGFFPINNFDDKEVRNSFLENYTKMNEYDLYQFYLNQTEVDYRKMDNSLDYDKIYEILKYDIAWGFLGGKHYNHVYLVIKLLELTFKTTLGFPKKLCNSKSMYSCYPDERAKEWMIYLNNHAHLQKNHNEPVSFSYE